MWSKRNAMNLKKKEQCECACAMCQMATVQVNINTKIFVEISSKHDRQPLPWDVLLTEEYKKGRNLIAQGNFDVCM